MAEAAAKSAEEFPITLTIERAVLLKSLARLQSIVEKRNTIPILSNIKLDATGSSLQLTVTDMEIAASETVAADVKLEGALTVPAATLYDIVRKIPEGAQISLDTDTDATQLVVESGNARFVLSYLPAAEFPVMSEGEMSHEFSLSTESCLDLIDKSRFAMSTEETRYYLNGVYFHAANDESGSEVLKAVATDGHRLARVEAPLPKGASGMPGVIIPRKTVNELNKFLEEQGGEVGIKLSETKIRFQAGDVVLLSKLVDGTFPDYERVIPDNNDKNMELDTKLLRQAVDRVSTISTEKTRGVRFGLSAGKLTLFAQSPEAGSAKEEIDVTYSADEFEIGFNSRYVLEMMQQLEGETTQFVFADSNSPTIVRDPSDVTSLYVIMPMRV